MEPTNLLSVLQNGKFVLMVFPESVEVHPLPDQVGQEDQEDGVGTGRTKDFMWGYDILDIV